ncbi:MAG: aminotransferase class IV, partial [Candidatus Aminicenantes bacterium]|nr:aminotransferase class IV [Candidatus Aminicenantes bacterium]
MAKFEGIQWASKQMRYMLPEKHYELLDIDSQVYAVSRSVHYALFLAFEGIRFFCRKNAQGGLEVIFLNWIKNLERFQRGIAFNFGSDQQNWVPSVEEMEKILIHRFFKEPALRSFFEEMDVLGAQGYLRPYTVDERYDRYLGEPFTGVVVPHMVRAVGVNMTGCLKLGVNYLMSVKAVDAAKKISPEAASALFLDDNPRAKIEERNITEWDSSCCLFAFRDGTVVKIPESNLILPSVTIQGIVAILREMGIKVEERHITYGELLERAKGSELVAASSIGTAGILNRCFKLVFVDGENHVILTHQPDQKHPLFQKLGEAKEYYW